MVRRGLEGVAATGDASSAMVKCQRLPRAKGQWGYTLTELVVTLILTGILAALAVPMLSTSTINEVQFYNETRAFLRYAQKTAISQRRNVCVAFTTQTVTASVSTTFGGACSAALTGPGGISPYSATAPHIAGFAALPTAFTFDALGVPNIAQTLALSGAGSIIIEAGTGYVH